MKKLLALILVVVLMLSVVGCSNNTAGNEEPAPSENGTEPSEDATEPSETTDNYKIGIVTGTVSQGEEEFNAAQDMIAKYGDMIEHITYPDNFGKEVETTISQVASLASDPDMKAIVFVQAVPGAAAAIDKVRETREDILFVLGVPHEDPDVIAARADIALELNQLQRGVDIMETAKKMGAETFVHYSFPRHMSYELLSARRDVFKENAERLEIEFVEVDAPDPTGDAGTPGAQQFIIENVPQQVEKYGKDTAFFSTNCSMMEPLIKQSLEYGAIFPEQCCPSPYHGYPGALGIKIPEDKAGDLDYLAEQISEKVAEKGGTGRFGTWTKPANVAMIYAGVEYAKAFIEGEIDRLDVDAMTRFMKEATNDTENEVKLEKFEDYDNFILFVLGTQIF